MNHKSSPWIATNTVRRGNYKPRRHNRSATTNTFLVGECDHPGMIPLPRRRAICNSPKARSPRRSFATSRLENPKSIIIRLLRWRRTR